MRHTFWRHHRPGRLGRLGNTEQSMIRILLNLIPIEAAIGLAFGSPLRLPGDSPQSQNRVSGESPGTCSN